MIPKIIHYIWFGGNPLPNLAENCIASWKKHCPDFEIKKWDESTFSIDCAPLYVQEAYNSKKWAFVSDYVRLFALYNYGGIYMDTDVEVISSLDPFLKEHCFSGFETPKTIPTGIIGSEPFFPLILYLLEQYNEKHFIKEDGSFDLTTKVKLITNELDKHGFVPNNSYQIVDGMALYPNDFFCPKSYETGIISLTVNSVTIHHFNGSWHSEEDKEKHEKRLKIYEKYGVEKGKRVLKRRTMIMRVERWVKGLFSRLLGK